MVVGVPGKELFKPGPPLVSVMIGGAPEILGSPLGEA